MKRRAKPLPRVLTNSQVESILAVAASRIPGQGSRDYVLLRLLANGLRVSEVVKLAAQDLNLTADHPYLWIREGKGRKDRRMEVARRTARAVLDFITDPATGQPKETGPLFSITVRGVQKMVKRYAIAAGIPKPEQVSPHTFRHSYATEWCERGGDLDVLMKQLGHESIATTQKYLHTSGEKDRREVDRIGLPFDEGSA